MNDKRWSELLAVLHDETLPPEMVTAAGALQAEATLEDVPRLIGLLSDSNFFVREAAAWPLSDLGQVEALPQLLKAFQRGVEEGHDNDGLSAALIDLTAANAAAALPLLYELANSTEDEVRKTALWLIQFGQEAHDA